jgi:mono/diheme cytochrome c family protein
VILAGLLVVAGCGGGAKQPSSLDGRALFVQQCGACHTLADAGTKGSFGADLERNRPTRAAILAAIENGKGTMPAQLAGGVDAEKIAAYVARAVRR